MGESLIRCGWECVGVWVWVLNQVFIPLWWLKGLFNFAPCIFARLTLQYSLSMTHVKTFVYVLFIALIALACESKPQLTTAVKTTQKYDKLSTVFSLAWIADINSGMQGNPQALQTHASKGVGEVLLNDTVIACIGQWNILWGPVAFTHNPQNGDTCITDNTLMLLRGTDPTAPNKPMYVIAIAGTNSVSGFDWAEEDFLVTTMTQWPAPPAAGANNLAYFSQPSNSGDPAVTQQGKYISQGVCTGINNLFNKMSDGEKGSLIECLKRNAAQESKPIELAVTGHSLGGGLSPVVALALKDNQAYWDSKNLFSVSTYPFAGQSPGNKNFADYFNQNFNGKFFGQYNTLDVVPHGFDATMMPLIPNLYDDMNEIMQKQCIFSGLITCMNKKTSPFTYTTLYPANAGFKSNIGYSPAIDSLAKLSEKNMPQNFWEINLQYCGLKGKKKDYEKTVCFSIMAYEQHITAYVNQYGAQEVAKVLSRYYLRNDKKAPAFLTIPLIKECL